MSHALEQFRLASDLLHRQVGDDVFVLTAASRMHWLRSRTAGLLWQRLVAAGTDGIAAEALVAELTDTFDVAPSIAERDVAVFIERLMVEGLLVQEPAHARPALVSTPSHVASRLPYVAPFITSGDAFERVQLQSSSGCNEGIFECDIPC